MPLSETDVFITAFLRQGWYLLALTIHPEYLLWYLPPMNCCCFLAISNEWLLRHSSSAIRIKELSSRSIKRQEALLSYHLNNAWQIRPLYPQDSSLLNQYCHNVNQYMWIVDLIYRCDFQRIKINNPLQDALQALNAIFHLCSDASTTKAKRYFCLDLGQQSDATHLFSNVHKLTTFTSGNQDVNQDHQKIYWLLYYRMCINHRLYHCEAYKIILLIRVKITFCRIYKSIMLPLINRNKTVKGTLDELHHHHLMGIMG